MRNGPTVLRAFALSLAAGFVGSLLGGLLMSIYLVVRWSYFPFGASQADPVVKTIAAIPLMTFVTGFMGAVLAVPLALMIGPAIVLFLQGPIRSHFAISAGLITVGFAAFGSAFASWLDFGAGMDVPGAFVSAGVALTLCGLTKLYVRDEMEW